MVIFSSGLYPGPVAGSGIPGLRPGIHAAFPIQVLRTFISEFPILMDNARITLAEAALGLLCGIATGFAAAVLMDRFKRAYQAFYPIVVLTQTVPAVAMAPLLVLWFGYEMTPKVILIVITTFFRLRWGCSQGLSQLTRTRWTFCGPWAQGGCRYSVI